MINPIAAAAVPETRPDGAAEKPLITDDATRDTFLRLLVAQIQNQDPLNPLDPTEFVSQLAQFSEMEQMIQVRQTLEEIRDELRSQPQSGSEAEPAQA